MIKYLSVLFVLLFIVTGTAQAKIVRVLSPSIGRPDDGLTLNFDFDFGFKSGNVNQLKLTSAFGTEYMTAPHRFILKGSGAYQLVDDEVKTEKAFGHIRYMWYVLDPMALFTFVQTDNNRFRKLNIRFVGGLGAEFRIFSTESFEINAAPAYMPEYEELQDGVEGDQGWFHRLSNYLMLILKFNDTFQLSSTTFYQPRIDLWEDFKVLEDLTFKISVTEYLDVKFGLVYYYDSKPPAGVEHYDLELVNSISLKIKPD